MHAFTDSEGRAWMLALTIGSAKRVRALLDVDLLELCAPGEGKDALPLLTRLGTDVMLLCDVIFALLKPQADEQGVSDEQWALAMGGDAILKAQKAFYEEMVDFFHRLGRRDVEKAARKQQQMIELAVQAGEKRLEEIEPDKEVAAIFDAVSGSSLTSSPGSSE